jgi:hypothetical protein
MKMKEEAYVALPPYLLGSGEALAPRGIILNTGDEIRDIKIHSFWIWRQAVFDEGFDFLFATIETPPKRLAPLN